MPRRPGFWITGLAAVLAIALVAAPLWDAWRYRRLRAVGPHVPVGVILPLRTIPPAPPRTRALEPIAAPALPAATGAPASAAGEPLSATSASPAMAPPAPSVRGTAGAPEPPAPPRGPAGHADARRVRGAPHAGPAAGPADLRHERGPVPDTAASPRADTGNHATADAIGWVPVPVSNAGPQPPPGPQDGPLPPRPAAPAPGSADPDPRPTPQAIPTLQLVPVRPALSVGDSLVVSVRLSGASDVSSLPFHVEFDPAVLEFQSVEEGPAVGGSMQPILLASVSPARPGDLAVGLSLVETGGLLQGDGTVMRLKFRAIGPGSSPLDFSHATIRGRMSETLDARFQNAAVEVR